MFFNFENGLKPVPIDADNFIIYFYKTKLVQFVKTLAIRKMSKVLSY